MDLGRLTLIGKKFANEQPKKFNTIFQASPTNQDHTQHVEFQYRKSARPIAYFSTENRPALLHISKRLTLNKMKV